MIKRLIIIIFLLALVSCSGSSDKTPPEFAGITGAQGTSTTSILLSWSPATDDSSSQAQIRYLIYVAESSGGQDFSTYTESTDKGVASFELLGLKVKTPYYFVVRARDEGGNIDANTVELRGVALYPILNEPANVTTTAMDISWEEYTKTDFSGYSLHRSTVSGFTPGAGNMLASFSEASQTSYADSGLTTGTTYYYRLVMLNTDEPEPSEVLSDEVMATAIDSTDVKGNISGTVVWSRSNSPLTLTGDIKVLTGAKLVIAPGVTVAVNDSDSADLGLDAARIAIIVDGTLDISGSSAQKVTFASSAGSPSYDDWWGIKLNTTSSDNSVIKWVDLSNADNGIQMEGVSPTVSNVAVTDSGLSDNARVFAAYGGSEANIDDCSVTNSSRAAFYFENFSGTVSGLVADNAEIGFQLNDADGISMSGLYAKNCQEGLRISGSDSSMVVTVWNSTFEDSTSQGIYIQRGVGVIDHCSITGSAGDGIYLAQSWDGTEGASLELRNSEIDSSGGYGVHPTGNPTVSRQVSIRDSNITNSSDEGVKGESGSYDLRLSRVYLAGNNGAASGTADISTAIPDSSSIPAQYVNVDSVTTPSASPISGAGDPD